VARPRLTESQRAEADDRRRTAILTAMAACVAQHGYAATTIAQVAAGARVSKSAVYAHFADKEEVFLALYATATERLLRIVRDAEIAAREAHLPWRERIAAPVRTYLMAMQAGGDLTRAMLVEAPAVSDRGMRARRAVIDRYVEELGAIAEALADDNPELRRPSRTALLVGIGGANEILLEALEPDGNWSLEDMIRAATEIASIVLTGSP
jgi:AcrR family transcriptional regulator